MPDEGEAIIKRVMPHSTEAEQSVIGAMMINQEAIPQAMELLTADDFYTKQYGLVFGAITSLYSENKPVDMVTLQNRLKEMDVPPEVSSLEFARELISVVPTSANVKSYAQIVAEKSLLRRLINVNDKISNECYSGRESVDKIMEDTEKEVFQVLQRHNTAEYIPIRQVVLNVLERIEKASQNKGNVTGLPTGFTDLDYKTSGFQNSDLILIAARPSMGKTAFALNIAGYMAFRKNLPVAVFSLEMSNEQLVNRLLAMESHVDAQMLRNGNLDEHDWTNLSEGATIIGNSNLIIDDTPGITITEMRSKCRKYKLEHNIAIIMVDYLQLMQSSRSAESVSRKFLKFPARSRALPVNFRFRWWLCRSCHVPLSSVRTIARCCQTCVNPAPLSRMPMLLCFCTAMITTIRIRTRRTSRKSS